MKFEVTINTVNSASWMLCIGHGGFNVRTDKATFNMFLPNEPTRVEALIELSAFIRNFNIFTPDMGDEGADIALAVCHSFDVVGDDLLMIDASKPVDYYRSWTYEKYCTAVVAIKELV